MSRRSRYICCLVALLLALTVIAMTSVRWFGPPWGDVFSPVSSFGRKMKVAAGWTVRTRWNDENGPLRTREVYRLRLSREGPHGVPVLVRGDYFDSSGHRRSTIRFGSGVQSLFHDAGPPSMTVHYLDGLKCGPRTVWFPDGRLRGYDFHDSLGRQHGVQCRYFTNGVLRSERTYDHGGCVGAAYWWNAQGELVRTMDFSGSNDRDRSET